jgi:hypothetical protein
MLTPLATLAFLMVLWLASLVVADLLDQRLDKIIAALRGRSMLACEPSVRLVAVRVSQRARPARVLRARPQLRAAA